MKQAFLNLFLNAIQSIESGGIIEIKAKAIGVCNEFIVSIRDTGKGMSAQELEVAFEPFYTTKKLGEGIGLGLITSKAIIEAHDGKLEVQSTPGEGTLAKIILPLCDGAKEGEKGAVSFDSNSCGQEDQDHDPKVKSILIVDDELDILDVIKECLAPLGCTVETCANSDKAHALVKEKAFDVAIIDYKIPGGNGIKIAEFIMQNNLNTKILMMSGESVDREVVKIRSQKPYPFLIKPFKLRALLEIMKDFGLDIT
jgi:CheY-like chemotaxis protein